jgi:hypothetical protein
MTRKTPPGTPAPALADYAEVMAVKALASGTANDRQQQIALKWIVEKAARRFDDPWSPDQRETDFNLGRMRVGMSITDLVHMPNELVEQLRKKADG